MFTGRCYEGNLLQLALRNSTDGSPQCTVAHSPWLPEHPVTAHGFFPSKIQLGKKGYFFFPPLFPVSHLFCLHIRRAFYFVTY